MPSNFKSHIKPVALSAAIAIAVLAFDLSMPLGVAGGVPYVALVLIALWSPWHHYIYVMAAMGTVLTVVGYYASSEGGIPWVVLTNRGLAILAIWSTALLILALRQARILTMRRAHEALESAEPELSAALEGVSDGLAIFDRDDRLVFCNQNYREIFAELDDVLVVGAPFENIARAGAERGVILDAAGSTDDWVRDRVACHRAAEGVHVQHLRGDRWVQTVERRTANGGIVCIRTDVTERKRAVEALKESEARYARAASGANDGLWEWNILTDEDYRSPRWEEILGYGEGELERTYPTLVDLVHPDDRDRVSEAMRAHLEERAPYDIEFRLRHKTGADVWVHSRGLANWDASGRPTLMSGTITDITESKRAEEALRESEDRLCRSVLDAPNPIMIHADDGEVLMISNRWTELSGYSHSDIPTILDWTEKAYGADKDHMRERIGGLYTIEEPYENKAFVTTASGEQRVWDFRTAPLGSLADGRRFVISMAVDVTARRRAEKEIRNLSRAIEQSPASVMIVATDGNIEYVNPKFLEVTGYDADEVLGRNPRFLKSGHATAEEYRELWRTITAGGAWRGELHSRKKNGELFWEAASISAVKDANGAITHYVAVKEDITEKKATADALRDHAARMRAIMDNAVVGLITADDNLVVRSFNLAAEKMFGYSAGEVVGSNISMLAPPKHGEDRRPALGENWLTHGPRGLGFQRECVGRRKDGAEFPMEIAVREIHLENERGFIASIHDITSRLETEEQLRQAQKMEAVGQLTGGLAHDFNNVLAIVLGNLELAREKLPHASDLGPFIDTCINATLRGAGLTQQLLTYSRKQALDPQITDINTLVTELSDLLRWTLGEKVEVQTVLEPNLWRSHVDRNQVSNALLNLAVNARDAMPRGGELIITTANVDLDDAPTRSNGDPAPCPYVMLAVMDNGVGMTPEVLEHAFDPFFTTKGIGEGTGLGLSTVYGFAKQSGGDVRIASAPGQGTTVEMFFPKAVQDREAEDERVAPATTPATGEATILVVEDEPDLRYFAVTVLKGFGYDTLEAGDAASALEVLERASRIDVLFTDVALPRGMDGPELAELAKARHPGLNVLFTTGHLESGMTEKTTSTAAATLLRKPYRKDQLAAEMHRILASEAG